MRKEKKNILCVANLPSDVGYAWWLMESFWVEIATLGQSLDRNTYLCYPKLNALPEPISASSIICDEFDLHSASYDQLKDYLESRQIGFAYFSDTGSYTALYVKLKLAGVNSIINHTHTPGLRPRIGGLKRIFKLLINSFPLISADLNIAATDFVKNRLLQNTCIPEFKVKTVKNGIPIRPLPKPADLRKLLGISPNSIIAINVARANRYKGIDDLIDAVAMLRNRGEVELHMVYIGDGPHLGEFKARARSQNVCNNVHFLGKRDDVLSLLQGADFAIHPSRGEVGYSLAILEYMYCGLAVIVPDNPSVCEAIDHDVDGLIYESENKEDLAKNIEFACRHRQEMSEMGKHAHNKVVTQYNIRDTHKSLVGIFGQIMS